MPARPTWSPTRCRRCGDEIQNPGGRIAKINGKSYCDQCHAVVMEKMSGGAVSVTPPEQGISARRRPAVCATCGKPGADLILGAVPYHSSCRTNWVKWIAIPLLVAAIGWVLHKMGLF